MRLVAAGVVVLLIAGLPRSGRAEDTDTPKRQTESEPAPELSKKEQQVRAKAARAGDDARKTAWQRKLAKRIGKKPEGVINVFNGWTHENLVVPADSRNLRFAEGEVDRFLRCRFTNKTTDMDDQLLPTAIRAAQHFGSDRIVVVSAYRSPKYNLMLRKKGREVSRRSQHKHGKALDFRIDGVSTARLRDWAKELKLGGVGYYGKSAFIHIDTAHIRYWNGR